VTDRPTSVDELRVVAIIPMKSFDRSKSRLRDVLSPIERRALAQRMFDRVLDAASRASLSGVLVATDDETVAHRAEAAHARVLRDNPAHTNSLGLVIDAALAHARGLECDAALVLMGDLPQLEAEDIDALKAGLARADVVLVPDRRGRSTNALALRIHHALPTCFGLPDSLARHEVRSAQHGLRTLVMHNAGIAHDVDTHVDLMDLMNLEEANAER
jgi:2-phospho-L-lactate guanylyltransferase